MTETENLDRKAQALLRALGYREVRHQEPGASQAAAGLTIALSCEAGTAASEIARAVGDRLGWPVYDHEILEMMARELSMPIRVLEHADERPQSWLLECIKGFGLGPHLSEGLYVRHLVKVLSSLGERGSCVIVGRGAAQLLPPRSTLKVRLVGAAEDRINRLRHLFHLGTQEAARKVQEIDGEQTYFVKDHFYQDPTNPRNYDLVLNTSPWSTAECAELILKALRHKEAMFHPDE
jgi:cytidylate kinase